jgi:hypothetical protein
MYCWSGNSRYDDELKVAVTLFPETSSRGGPNRSVVHSCSFPVIPSWNCASDIWPRRPSTI